MNLNLYMIGGFLVALLAMGGYVWWQETKISALTTETQHLTIERDAARASVATLEATTALQARQVERFRENVAEIDAHRLSERAEVERLKAQFGSHNLSNLLDKKPGLIEKRMIEGTAAILQELEDATAIDPALQ